MLSHNKLHSWDLLAATEEIFHAQVSDARCHSTRHFQPNHLHRRNCHDSMAGTIGQHNRCVEANVPEDGPRVRPHTAEVSETLELHPASRLDFARVSFADISWPWFFLPLGLLKNFSLFFLSSWGRITTAVCDISCMHGALCSYVPGGVCGERKRQPPQWAPWLL